MEVAVAADAVGGGRAGTQPLQTLEDLALPLQHLPHLAAGRILGCRITENLAGQAAGSVEERHPVLHRQRFGREIRDFGSRRQCHVELGRPTPEQRCPLQVGPDEGMVERSLGELVVRSPTVRRPVREAQIARGQRVLETMRKRVDQVVPSVAFVRHELLQDRHRAGGNLVAPRPVFNAAASPRGVWETGPFAEEPPELDRRVDALFEAADELHHGLLVQAGPRNSTARPI